MDFIITLLEDLGMDFVEIGSSFLDHLDQFDVMEKFPQEETPVKKRCVEYLYIEADEDHVPRQKVGVEHAGSFMGKLVYLFEGKEDVCEGRRRLIRPHYHGGLYQGSDENAALWTEVQRYIEAHYDTDVLKRVYISGDGANWIKVGVDYVDRSVFVADRFHLMKYINRVSRLMLDDEKFIKQKFYSNWEAIHRAFRDKHVLGCSAEGHVSSVYADRMSSSPMGWSEDGCDAMCHLRCYVRNEGRGKIIDLVKYRRKQAMQDLEATGTDGMIEITSTKRHYTKTQLVTAAYEERMRARIGGLTIRKMLAIREQIGNI